MTGSTSSRLSARAVAAASRFAALRDGYDRVVSFKDAIELAGKTLDGLGVVAIVAGFAYVSVVAALSRSEGSDRYRTYRQGIGRVILLGLEILVAADIIRTVAVSPTFTSVGILAIIVLVRTFLSFTLEVELDGRWPWQRL